MPATRNMSNSTKKSFVKTSRTSASAPGAKKVSTKPKVVKAKAATKTTDRSAQITLKAVQVKDPYTKSELLGTIAEHVELSRKQVGAVFDSLGHIIEQHVKKRGPQIFTLPGLCKIKVITKPATKARDGVNPFTGEKMTFKAKPARQVVKVVPLKALKDMVD